MSFEDADNYEDTFSENLASGVSDQDEHDAQSMKSDADIKPRIFLMGLQNSGKSSIQKVVFHKMSPNESESLESTKKIVKDDINHSSLVQLEIWDFPGQMNFIDPIFDTDMIFPGRGAVIFVIDAKDDYEEALTKFKDTVIKAHKINPLMKFEIFIHKVDGMSDDLKMESQIVIRHCVSDILKDADLNDIHLSFHLTTIFDFSIFEAFSKVVQKLIPQLPTLEHLLNIFVLSSGIEKAFLFDVVSKICIATDSSPVDMQTYGMCCDMIDLVIDLSSIYSSEEKAFDHESSSVIKLSDTILYLREVNKFLALVCVLHEKNSNRLSVIEYNFSCYHEAMNEVFKLHMKTQKLKSIDEGTERNNVDETDEEDDKSLAMSSKTV